jgi:hypothetical protein
MKSLVWMSVLVMGCGGGSEAAPPQNGGDVEDPYGAGSGDNPGGSGEEGTTTQGPQEPQAGPASVMVKAVMDGNEVAARIQILADDGHVVSEGEAPLSAQVTSGSYTFTAQITDAAILVDRPTVRNEGVAVAPGGPHNVTVSIPRAQVRLKVMRGGREIRNPEITLMHQGSTEPVHTYRPGAALIPISPGRYEADLKMGREVIHVQGITFMEGATQDIPIVIN